MPCVHRLSFIIKYKHWPFSYGCMIEINCLNPFTKLKFFCDLKIIEE